MKSKLDRLRNPNHHHDFVSFATEEACQKCRGDRSAAAGEGVSPSPLGTQAPTRALAASLATGGAAHYMAESPGDIRQWWR